MPVLILLMLIIRKAINDLETSPTNPQLIASASDDLSIRLWSLDPVHEKQPCAAILASQYGHRENIMSIVCDINFKQRMLISKRLIIPVVNIFSPGV